MAKIKYNIPFIPDTEKGKPDEPLRIRVKGHRGSVAFCGGYRVNRGKSFISFLSCPNKPTP